MTEEAMTKITRRDVIKAGVAAGAAVATVGGPKGSNSAHAAAEWSNEPEAGAQIRVLRWKQFIKSEYDSFAELTRKFVAQTGIKVRLDTESWEDIRPKAAVAANVGAGPDLIIGTLDDPHKFPDQLIDLTDLADYLGAKYAGWYDVAKRYGVRGDRWNYRTSHVRAAGFETFPKDTDNFLKLCEALKKNGTPPGYALGHATGDANGWVHWCLWSHGGKMVDEKSNVVIDSPETVAAIEYAMKLYDTFIPGVLSWQDPSNNKAFLAGDISLTLNGISIYTVAKTSPDPALQAIAKDMDHANLPIGPVGRPTELQLVLVAYAYKYSKYPKAVKEYLRFMWEKDQYEPWQQASNGYISPPLAAFTDNPVWTADPKVTPFRDLLRNALDNGYAGMLGYASAAVMGDFVLVDMFAEACTRNQTPKAAAQRAAERAKRYYQV
jgi:multiple sugar transport system substrate-binding protein